MSLYKRLHEAQNGPGGQNGAPKPGVPGNGGGSNGIPGGNQHQNPNFGSGPEARQKRDPILDQLRQKIHHHVIEEIGPLIFDNRLSEEELQRSR